MAFFPSELILKCGSYRQHLALPGRVSALSQGRYPHRKTKAQNKRRYISMPQVGFKPTIPVFDINKMFGQNAEHSKRLSM
jgi:hypothetical protein